MYDMLGKGLASARHMLGREFHTMGAEMAGWRGLVVYTLALCTIAGAWQACWQR